MVTLTWTPPPVSAAQRRDRRSGGHPITASPGSPRWTAHPGHAFRLRGRGQDGLLRGHAGRLPGGGRQSTLVVQPLPVIQDRKLRREVNRVWVDLGVDIRGLDRDAAAVIVGGATDRIASGLPVTHAQSLSYSACASVAKSRTTCIRSSCKLTKASSISSLRL